MLTVQFSAENLEGLTALCRSFASETPVPNEAHPVVDPLTQFSPQDLIELINGALYEQGLQVIITELPKLDETAEPAPAKAKRKAAAKKEEPKTEPAPTQSTEGLQIPEITPQGTLLPAQDKETKTELEGFEAKKEALDLLIKIHRAGKAHPELDALKKSYGVDKFSYIPEDKGQELLDRATALAKSIGFEG
jgi:hypothetical protein